MPQQLIDREAVLRLFDEAIDRGLISKTAAVLFRQLIAALPVEQPEPTTGSWVDAESVRRLAKELDVAMNGGNAASKPALCDVVAQAIRIFRSTTPVETAQATSAELLNFLYGSGPLDGVWFGESHPTERGAFWWRKYLPLLRAPQQQAEPTGEVYGTGNVYRVAPPPDDKAVRLLRELCRLKAYKDSLGKTSDYERDKAAAWAAANAYLASKEQR